MEKWKITVQLEAVEPFHHVVILGEKLFHSTRYTALEHMEALINDLNDNGPEGLDRDPWEQDPWEKECNASL